MGNVKTIKVADIHDNPVALRSVDKAGEAFMGLCDSIRNIGFQGSVTVRTCAEGGYSLIDGLHRITACREVGIQEVTAVIMELSDVEVWESQLLFNVHHVETKPIEYTKHMVRLMTANPLMTEAELAHKLGKSAQWVKERLGLIKIADEKVQSLIDSGKISLSNAYALSKLDSADVADFVDRAMTLPVSEFGPQVEQRVREVRDNRRKGRDSEPTAFAPLSFLQKKSDIESQYDNPDTVLGIITQQGVKDIPTAVKIALQWVCHMDPVSVAAQVAKDEERKAARAAASAKAAEERAKKKAEQDAKLAGEAAEVAAEAKAKLAK